MVHQSDNSRRLQVDVRHLTDLSSVHMPNRASPEAWLFVLPFGRRIADAERCCAWFETLQRFAESLHRDSIIAILTSSEDAAETWPRVGHILRFQLWVAVKLASPISDAAGQLPSQHAALLILSSYRTSLRHTKTRIGYTFCPACDKTTKDYGGKKHTYHSYGTLLSDVWRDINYAPGNEPNDVIIRLADLLGLDPYRRLNVVDVTSVESLSPCSDIGEKREPVAAEGKSLDSALINADSIEALRRIPSDSVDWCFADPPYNLDKRYDAWDDAIDVAMYLNWCNEWLDEMARVLRPGCTCAVLNIPVWAIRHFQHMKRLLRFQSWIVWEGLSLPVRFIMPAHYSIVCFSKGAPRPVPGLTRANHSPDERDALMALREDYCSRRSCVVTRQKARESDRELVTDLWWDIHRLKHNSRRVDHPCQLPPALMRRLISLFTWEDEVVLDPFNGAGTTTLCAQSLGRRYIGIDLSEKYHALATERHRLLESGEDPFQKVKRVPQAKNSRVERIGGVQYKVSKKTLQLEVRRVARLLGRLPTREDVRVHARYPLQYYDEYFVSWGEVCAAARHAGMSETRNGLPSASVDDEANLFDSISG